jgi:hypothetical protein
MTQDSHQINDESAKYRHMMKQIEEQRKSLKDDLPVERARFSEEQLRQLRETTQITRFDHMRQLTEVPRLETNSALREFAEMSAARNRKQDEANDCLIGSSAGVVCAHLAQRIVAFNQTLDDSEEVGVRLVSFGQSVVIHVRHLTFQNPCLVIFYGDTETGRVELIQHVSQLSFLLMAVKRLNPEEPKQDMGFHTLLQMPPEDPIGQTEGP